MASGPESDPFAERHAMRHRAVFAVLGADLRVESNSPELLALARSAFASLPRHRWSGRRLGLQLSLRLVRGGRTRRNRPPAPRFSSGAGMLCAHVDADNFAVLTPARRTALVQVSSDRLRFPYHVRYELIEFAALTLAARAQGLVPLHGACVGRAGRGLLLLGDSGAGKSTLSLACALDGFALLAEDAIFARPSDARASGLANFLHVAAGGLRLLRDRDLRARVRAAPRIRRRSGARKFELDARASGLRLARTPLAISATVVLSRERTRGALLETLDGERLAVAVRRTQAYAKRQPGWAAFEDLLIARGGYLLRRGSHPGDSVRALRDLLAGRRESVS